MRRTRRLLGGLVLLAMACRGSDGPPTSSQAAAKAWMTAALATDEAALRAVSVDSAETALVRQAEHVRSIIKEPGGAGWQKTTTTSGDEAWMAQIKGAVVTVDAKKVGDHWQVCEVNTSD